MPGCSAFLKAVTLYSKSTAEEELITVSGAGDAEYRLLLIACRSDAFWGKSALARRDFGMLK